MDCIDLDKRSKLKLNYILKPPFNLLIYKCIKYKSVIMSLVLMIILS